MEKDTIVLDSSTLKQKEEGVEILEEKNNTGVESDCMVEISRQETTRRSEISDSDLRTLVVRCSSCGQQINHNDPSKVRQHRRLGVLTCKDCHEFYGSSEFSQDENGYNYCTWCGNGGKLYICDYCPNGFCTSCIRRNFGRAEVSETSKEGWKCYFCNKDRLKSKVAFCSLILQYSKRAKEQKERRSLNSVAVDKKIILSQDFVKSAFDDTDEICRGFQTRMAKLRNIGLTKSKSLRHIIKKMEQIINTHKSELKTVVNTLSKQYTQYLEHKLKEDSNTKQEIEPKFTEKEMADGILMNEEEEEVKVDNCIVETFSQDRNFPSVDNKDDMNNNLDNQTSDKNFEAESKKSLSTEDVMQMEESSVVENMETPITNGISPSNGIEDSKIRKDEEQTENNSTHTFGESKISKTEDDINAKDNIIKNSVVFDKEDILTDNECEPVLDSVNDICKLVSDSLNADDKTETNDKYNENVLAKMSLLESTNSESEEKEPSNVEEVASKNKVKNKLSSKLYYNNVNSNSNTSSDSSLMDDLPKKKRSRKKKNKNIIKNGGIPGTITDNIDNLKVNQEKCNNDSKNLNTLPTEVTKAILEKSGGEESFKSLSEESGSDSDSSSLRLISDKNESEKPVKSKIQSIVKDANKHNVIIDENDPKLKLHVRINLERCDNMLKPGELSVILPTTVHHHKLNLDDIDKLEKLVSNLSKEVKISIPERNKECQVKKKPTKKEVISVEEEHNSSSSSICFSSEEELKLKKKEPMKPIDLNSLAKKQLMTVESSSEVSSDSDIVEVKKPKSSGTSTKKQESSDDFIPKKKKKTDKLLHGKLLSDDETTDMPKGKKSKTKSHCKRKLILSDDDLEGKKPAKSASSDETATSSDEEDKRKKSKQKKRKRIKLMSNSSSNAGSDVEIISGSQDTPAGKGRKNINKIISQKDLTDETKQAQQIEKERKKRIMERQNLYNEIVDKSADGKEVITRKLVLEVDPVSKEEIVEIHPDIIDKLKPHQVNGVKFMWECTIESTKDLDKPGSGCILAHCMGLGKTLQVIAFLLTCFSNELVKKKMRTAMIICPYNTLLNWVNEFDIWLNEIEHDIKIHHLGSAKDNYARLDILEYWHQDGGVIILSYDIFRRLAMNKIPKFRSRHTQKVHEYLLDPGPDIVVCDEGHVLKNVTSAIAKSMSKLKTERRIVLTGTPLQNNLMEYHCMLSFVKPHLLGTPKEFRNRFVNPIMNGQYDDSNLYDVKLMKKRTHILHKLLEGCVQRCDYFALTKFLPPKHEYVISIKLSEVQINMYRCYLERLSQDRNKSKSSGTTLFTDFNSLRCIWTHPYMCHMSFQRAEKKMILEDEDSFIDDSEISERSSSEESVKSKSLSDTEEVIKTYKTRRRQGLDDNSDESEEPAEQKQWYHEFISDDDKHNIQLSGKLILLIDILKECGAIGDKIIVFSQSLLTLDLIEDILLFLDQQPLAENDEIPDYISSWVKGLDYFRMDGSTSADFRKGFIDMFNNPDNDRARLFLISTRAGSLGTNLVGANRVVIFDTSWNPCHDVQAIFRVFRFGQIKPVYIYRLLSQGTMEEKIYDRQVTKLSLSIRVVDEQQIDRHFSAADLMELYQFNPESTSNRPTPMVPKDRLLAEMLIKNSDWIVTYHEHDSLLQNETEEDLTEEERQAAWTEYENEREGRVINPGISEEDLTKFYAEPDFTLTDYEDKKIPDIRVIIQAIANRLVSKSSSADPMEFRRNLLQALFAVRTTFQEKHVKILRMKQEYVARGTVPNAVNKYLEELNQILKALFDYITSVQMSLNDMQKKEAMARMQKQAQAQRSATAEQFRMRVPVEQMRMTSGMRMGSQRPQYVPIVRGGERMMNMNFQARPFIRHGVYPQYFRVNIPTTTYMRAPVRQPVISEPSEESVLPDIIETSNTKSTVHIEEVE